MYKNPINPNLSDYNSLKKQRNNGAIVEKYSSVKLQTKPTEKQKYYEYLTYQQPILDEINYLTEKLRNEETQKNNEILKKTEEIKNNIENEMKNEVNISETTEEKERIKNELFDTISNNNDLMPSINTDFELEFKLKEELAKPKILELPKIKISDNFMDNMNSISQVPIFLGKGRKNPISYDDDELFSTSTTINNNKEEFFNLSKDPPKMGRPKKEKTPEELAIIEEKKLKSQQKKEELRLKQIELSKTKKTIKGKNKK